MAQHCHFSILWNELPFLKQKMPFLYKHFDQLIFYDLNIMTSKFSDDGSHEFIKEFPDPEGKITLIEKRNLNDVTKYKGVSFKEKCQMFAVGSKLVRDDIDYFWCTDMDEFFTTNLIKIVSEDTQHQSFVVPHLIFFKNENWVFSNGKENGDLPTTIAARVARHKPGNLYGHCTLNRQFKPARRINNEWYSHFAYVGDSRIDFKCKVYNYYNYRKFWNSFLESEVKGPGPWGVGIVHPSLNDLGIVKNTRKIPEYIDVPQLMKDLNAS